MFKKLFILLFLTLLASCASVSNKEETQHKSVALEVFERDGYTSF